jgi:hypothetical protein
MTSISQQIEGICSGFETLRRIDDVTKHFHAAKRRLGMALVDEMMFS